MNCIDRESHLFVRRIITTYRAHYIDEDSRTVIQASKEDISKVIIPKLRHVFSTSFQDNAV